MLCGGCHPSVEICNSLLFPVDAFAMHLPRTELVKIRTERLCTTVLCQNVPQLVIQLYILTSVDAIGGNSIIYLATVSTIGSIAFSSLYYCANRQKQVPLSKNHWIFRMRLSSNDIAEHHQHSYHKLQVAVSKALEIPNKEWVRITGVHHKANELRCDGFISIPDHYLNNGEQNDALPGMSAVYSNTFDDAERDLFVNRLEAAKEDKSHYHMSLVKQLEIDIGLNGLKVDFEIGGKEAREGGEFPAEGDVDEHDANNNTLSAVPGMPNYHNGAEYDDVIQVEMQELDEPKNVDGQFGSPRNLRTDNGMIEQMLENESSDRSVDVDLIVDEDEVVTPKGLSEDDFDADLLNGIDVETIAVGLEGDPVTNGKNVLNEFEIDTIQ